MATDESESDKNNFNGSETWADTGLPSPDRAGLFLCGCVEIAPHSKMVMSLIGEGVTRMPDLSIEVREHEIIVTKPSQGLQVRYRKLGKSPMLVSDDPMPNKPNNDELNFRVRAWNAAFAKAKELCWI